MRRGFLASWTGLVGFSFFLLANPSPPLPAGPPPSEITVLLGGDVMLGRGVDRRMAAAQDFTLPLRNLAPLFEPADLVFVNLESPLCPTGPYGQPNTMLLRARPEAMGALLESGVDVVSLANNHSLDCGVQGLAFTREQLQKAGIAAIGAGEDFRTAHQGAVLERRGVRIGFLAYTYAGFNDRPGAHGAVVAGLNREQLRVDIGALRRRADLVVVSLHAGAEYSPHPSRQQQEFARAAIEAGALLVVGHHPHVVQPMESHGSGTIFYSLGNLVFDQPWPATQSGWLLRARIVGRKLVEADLLGVQLEDLCCPRLAEAQQASRKDR